MTATINKYGVPLPSGRNLTMMQPKVQHRFRISVYNFGTGTVDERDWMALNVESADRPSISFETHELAMFTSPVKYFGKHSYKPINVTVRDDVGNHVAKSVAKQIQRQLDFHRRITDPSNQQYSGYKFSVILEILSGENPSDTMSQLGRNTALDAATAITNNAGLVNSVDTLIGGSSVNTLRLEYWLLTGCFLGDIDYDELNYSSSSYNKIKLNIQYDTAVQYDSIEEMYSDQIQSTLGKKTDKTLNVLDKVFGNISL